MVESFEKDDYEGGLEKSDICGNVERKVLVSLVVFKQLILEEHWWSRFGCYLWYWGVKAMGERGGTKYEWKEKEYMFH